MLNCREATRLMSEQQERSLGTREKLELQVHLMLCKGCKNFSLQMPFLRQTMRAYSQRLDAMLDVDHAAQAPKEP
jgi:hypothetical protein